MPTRRIFLLVVVTGILLVPAKNTVYHWGRYKLGTTQPGSVMHGIGEVVVTVFQ